MIPMPDTDGRGDIPWDQCMESMRVLESRHVMSLLVYLGEQGPTPKMDIYNTISRGANMSDKLEALMSMGIIRMEKANKTMVSLTDTGETIAGHLRAVMDVLVRQGD